MENVLLIVHLILALCLIGIVLLQRSEGGMGSMGGGGGGGGVMSGRAAATALGKLTWIFAIAFICTSLALYIVAAGTAGGGSVVDGIAPSAVDDTLPQLPAGDSLLPPSAVEQPEGDLVPRAAD